MILFSGIGLKLTKQKIYQLAEQLFDLKLRNEGFKTTLTLCLLLMDIRARSYHCFPSLSQHNLTFQINQSYFVESKINQASFEKISIL